MLLSIVIPVYNRPEEVRELLESLIELAPSATENVSCRRQRRISVMQWSVPPPWVAATRCHFAGKMTLIGSELRLASLAAFGRQAMRFSDENRPLLEIIVVEDGSTVRCDEVVREFGDAAEQETNIEQSENIRFRRWGAAAHRAALTSKAALTGSELRLASLAAGEQPNPSLTLGMTEGRGGVTTGMALRRCDFCEPKSLYTLPIRYFFTENGGPGVARNYGAARAIGDYIIFLDSDCIVPPGWLAAVIGALPADAWGGPDRAAANFTPLQKAINYAMTSPITTGGIRGRAHSADRFYPRTFNMGVRRAVFEAVGGFAPMRYGEDIDLSYRIVEAGFQTKLVPAAWVYHKRRTSLTAFFRQVRHSGGARVELTRRHSGTLKLVHLLPAIFTVLCLTVAVPVIFSVIIFIDATLRTRSLRIGALAVAASIIQLVGYGWGMLTKK